MGQGVFKMSVNWYHRQHDGLSACFQLTHCAAPASLIPRRHVLCLVTLSHQRLPEWHLACSWWFVLSVHFTPWRGKAKTKVTHRGRQEVSDPHAAGLATAIQILQCDCRTCSEGFAADSILMTMLAIIDTMLRLATLQPEPQKECRQDSSSVPPEKALEDKWHIQEAIFCISHSIFRDQAVSSAPLSLHQDARRRSLSLCCKQYVEHPPRVKFSNPQIRLYFYNCYQTNSSQWFCEERQQWSAVSYKTLICWPPTLTAGTDTSIRTFMKIFLYLILNLHLSLSLKHACL